jgi:hypothetical protein
MGCQTSAGSPAFADSPNTVEIPASVTKVDRCIIALEPPMPPRWKQFRAVDV